MGGKAKLLDCEHYRWYLYRGPDEALWVEVWRTSAKVSSAIYRLLVKVSRDDDDWMAEPDHDFVEKIIRRALADENRYAAGPEADEYATLEFESPTPSSRD